MRRSLANDTVTLGSWMQLPCASVAEILGRAGYDWVAVDLEHGSISLGELPDIFRALELGGTLPLARIAEPSAIACKQALDAGAAGVIIPMIEDHLQLEKVRKACCWPPTGNRGVGFSRANLFGKFFQSYALDAQNPLIIAMIESVNAVNNLERILQVEGLDAILIGPYDLSASMKITAQFDKIEFKTTISKILQSCRKSAKPCGLHVVKPNEEELRGHVAAGHRFLAYSTDAVFLNHFAKRPEL
jgi:2-dehydro-3-deoxyglucarate aldolase